VLGDADGKLKSQIFDLSSALNAGLKISQDLIQILNVKTIDMLGKDVMITKEPL
jgi:hypothetical protein